MGEVIRPSNEEFEAAVAAALHRSNPLDEAHARAEDLEEFVNEHFDEEADEGTVLAYVNKELNELDKKCGHMHKPIIVNGLVKVRSINHSMLEAGLAQIQRESLEDTWKPVEDYLATSLGYFALWDGRNGNGVSIYHGARTQSEKIVSDNRMGEIFKTGRLFIPVDGSAQAVLANAPREINHEYMRYYIDSALMARIDEAIIGSESLSESVQKLGRISLKKARALQDVSLRESLVDYINGTLGIMKEAIYEISGANQIYYFDQDDNAMKSSIRPTKVMYGHIAGISIDPKIGRFRLVMKVPFEDNSVKLIVYRMSSTLNINKLPTFAHASKSRIVVK